MEYGMLINYGYCTGCHSCEISCRKLHDLPLDEWGIKVLQIGPVKQDGAWQWDFLPVLSRNCDLCEGRRVEGKKPLCELHCLAHVIEVLPVAEMSDRMRELEGSKTVCYSA